MILVKVVDGAVVKFPYSLEEIRMEYPNVSFPSNPSEAILNEYSAHIVRYYPYPEYDIRTQNILISNFPIFIDGEWSIRHTVIDKTEEEISIYDNDLLLTTRNKLLDAVDNKTNDLISYGFIFNGLHTRLLIEDQINFEGEFNLIKDLISNGVDEASFFPIVYKVWTNDDGSPVFLNINNLTELRTFLFEGKKYIRDCLAEGWDIKNSIILMTIDQLNVWTDPRNEV
jgi:hypothetical protein